MPPLHPYLPDEYLARLVATRFVPGRFRGRAELERDARTGDAIALARLESKLGLANKSAVPAAYEAEAERWAKSVSESYAKGEVKPRVGVHATVESAQRLVQRPQGKRLPLVYGMFARKEPGTPYFLIDPEIQENIRRKQAQREALRVAPIEPFYARLARKRLDGAWWTTWPRHSTTRHHTKKVEVVPRGEERVVSSSYEFWPRGGRYAERASKHYWYVSSAILNRATRELQEKNYRHIYLSPEQRVRSGRGSLLVTEILNKSRKVPRWIVKK